MVEFKSKMFIGILAAIMLSNLVVGLFMLLWSGDLIYIPGMLLAVMILVLMYMRDEYLVMCIKVWAGIVFVGGLAGLVSSCASYVNVQAGGTKFGPESYGVWRILKGLLFLGGGLFYFFYTSKYIVKKNSQVPEESSAS